MEGLKQYYIELETLRNQAIQLCADAASLADIFTEEANRLHRKAEASQLVALRSSIMDQLNYEKRLEDAVSYAHSKASLTISVGRLAAGVAIKLISKNKQLTAFSDSLLKKPSDKQRPFGNVFIYIGPNGIPGDVGVVSVSRLARESDIEESQVVNEMRQRGCLLLAEEDFSLLMDKLINDAKEGRWQLLIARKKLS